MWEIRDGAQILSACRLESICHYHEMSMEEKKEPVNTSKPKTQCRISMEKILIIPSALKSTNKIKQEFLKKMEVLKDN